MRSVIFSLVDPVTCCVLNRGLPNNGIKIFDHETLNPTSFPGWPSFGDLLCDGGSRTLIGITFHIPREHYITAKKIIDKMSPEIAELKQIDTTVSSGIYKNFPGSSWLEIKWSSISPNQIIDIQTCDVLWYQSANPRDQNTLIALGIEHLEHLAKEADYDLVVPLCFSFPQVKIAFLND